MEPLQKLVFAFQVKEEKFLKPKREKLEKLEDVIRVRAGGRSNAAQKKDGTWEAWGDSDTLNKQIPMIGKAIDLDLYGMGDSGTDYMIWIEPNQ